MTKQRVMIILFVLIFISGCTHDTGSRKWAVNDKEYIETPGFNVLVFNDYYPEGKQGGIGFIQHDNRIASNGFINIEPGGGKKFPLPERATRVVDKAKSEITAAIKVPEYDFNYNVRVWPEANSIPLAADRICDARCSFLYFLRDGCRQNVEYVRIDHIIKNLIRQNHD